MRRSGWRSGAGALNVSIRWEIFFARLAEPARRAGARRLCQPDVGERMGNDRIEEFVVM